MFSCFCPVSEQFADVLDAIWANLAIHKLKQQHGSMNKESEENQASTAGQLLLVPAIRQNKDTYH